VDTVTDQQTKEARQAAEAAEREAAEREAEREARTAASIVQQAGAPVVMAALARSVLDGLQDLENAAGMAGAGIQLGGGAADQDRIHEALGSMAYPELCRDGILEWTPSKDKKTGKVKVKVLSSFVTKLKQDCKVIIAYARVSSKGQVPGGGLMTQMQGIIDCACQKFGNPIVTKAGRYSSGKWTFAKTFLEAQSGFHRQERRTQFEQALSLYHALTKAGWKHVMLGVYSADRVGRDADVVSRLAKEGVKTLFATMPSLDTCTAAGLLALQVFAAIAQHDRTQMLERTKRGRESIKLRKALGDAAPAEVNPKMKAVSHAQRQKALMWKGKVADAALPLVTGGKSLGQIAKELTQAGFTTFKARAAAGAAAGGPGGRGAGRAGDPGRGQAFGGRPPPPPPLRRSSTRTATPSGAAR
jgi:DNA invertase Pin-like site-specific DNA recombinase